MKAKLLHLLESGNYVSGEEMSQTLGVSRTAIWKQLKALREQGYEIESAPRRGYKLLATPDTMLPHDVKPFLRTESFGQMIHYFDTVPSTQPLAHGYAAKECEEGTLVLANEQSDGRGRLGRRWQAKKRSIRFDVSYFETNDSNSASASTNIAGSCSGYSCN